MYFKSNDCVLSVFKVGAELCFNAIYWNGFTRYSTPIAFSRWKHLKVKRTMSVSVHFLILLKLNERLFHIPMHIQVGWQSLMRYVFLLVFLGSRFFMTFFHCLELFFFDFLIDYLALFFALEVDSKLPITLCKWFLAWQGTFQSSMRVSVTTASGNVAMSVDNLLTLSTFIQIYRLIDFLSIFFLSTKVN